MQMLVQAAAHNMLDPGCCSAYSNSFVNLAIFKPDVERSKVAGIIGKEAEELTHLFCVVGRCWQEGQLHCC